MSRKLAVALIAAGLVVLFGLGVFAKLYSDRRAAPPAGRGASGFMPGAGPSSSAAGPDARPEGARRGRPDTGEDPAAAFRGMRPGAEGGAPSGFSRGARPDSGSGERPAFGGTRPDFPAGPPAGGQALPPGGGAPAAGPAFGAQRPAGAQAQRPATGDQRTRAAAVPRGAAPSAPAGMPPFPAAGAGPGAPAAGPTSALPPLTDPNLDEWLRTVARAQETVENARIAIREHNQDQLLEILDEALSLLSQVPAAAPAPGTPRGQRPAAGGMPPFPSGETGPAARPDDLIALGERVQDLLFRALEIARSLPPEQYLDKRTELALGLLTELLSVGSPRAARGPGEFARPGRGFPPEPAPYPGQ